MQLLDAALGVPAVAAEVELAARARRARHGVGPADDADHEVAGREAAAVGRLEHAAERLVAEDEPLGAGRRPAVVAVDDLAVGAADAERDPVHEQVAGPRLGLGHVDDGRRAGLERDHGERAHAHEPTQLARVAHPHYHRDHMGSTTTRSTVSATRLAVALALQVALAVLDAAIGSGTRHHRHGAAGAARARRHRRPARGRRHRRGRDRDRDRQRLLERRRQHRPADLPDPLLHAPLAALARGRRAGARARHRARATNQALARDLACRAGAAGRDPRLARRGGHRPRRERQDRLRQRRGRRAARLRRASRRCSPPSRASSRRSFTITHEDGSAVAARRPPGPAPDRGRGRRRRCSRAASAPTPARRSGCSPRPRSRATPTARGWRSTSSRTSPTAKDAELRQRFLAEAGQLLASSLDYEQTLERVARMIVPRLADWCGIEMVDEQGEPQQVAVAHADPAKVAAGARAARALPAGSRRADRRARRSCAAARPSCTARSPTS